MVTFQELIRRLNDYWAAQGCAILQPYDVEVGAGTMHPATTLRCLGPEHWNVAYVQPSRRPADGRYTLNPMRSQRYYQYQVVMKPSPDDIVDRYMGSLDAIGFDTKKNDIRLVEDDWESQAAGAAGVGWEVWVDGTEVSQFTFFQQMGGVECDPVCAEITYGPERLCLMLNDQFSFWDGLMWNESLPYKSVDYELEMQNNVYNFEVADTELLFKLFDLYEAESKRVIETKVGWDNVKGVLSTSPTDGHDTESYGRHPEPVARHPEPVEGDDRQESSVEGQATINVPSSLGEGKGGGAPMTEALVYPALDLALKCSHIFNLLDARGAVSPTERAAYINRIRARVRACCLAHVAKYKVKAKA